MKGTDEALYLKADPGTLSRSKQGEHLVQRKAQEGSKQTGLPGIGVFMLASEKSSRSH